MESNNINLFFETSSKNSSNVEMAFQETAKLVFLNYLSLQLQKKSE